MANRMDRYYKGEARSKKNASLYEAISANGNYTNIEGVVDITNNNEINIESIKELIESSKPTQAPAKSVDKLSSIKTTITPVEEKKYDIKEVLDSAKSNHLEKNQRYRNLKKRQFQILKELKDEHPEDGKIDELMNTLSLDGILGDDLGMFDDLKSNTMVGGEIDAMKDIVEDAKIDDAKNEKTMVDINIGKKKKKVEEDNMGKTVVDIKLNNKKDKEEEFFTDSIELIEDDEKRKLKKTNIKPLIIASCVLIAIIILIVVAKSIF